MFGIWRRVPIAASELIYYYGRKGMIRMKRTHKLLGAAAAVSAAALLFCMPSLAANTVEITSAQTAGGTVLSDTAETAPAVGKSELITVDATISSPAADVTILVMDADVEPNIATVTEADIQYIDQDTSDEADGTCSITFRMPVSAAASTYAVYVSGTGVETKDVKYLKIASTSGETYICGDITKDGNVSSDDALWALRNEVGLNVPATADIEAGDVNEDTLVDSTDALWMLRYEVGLSLPDGIDVGEEKTK